MEKEHKSALRQSRVALVRDVQPESLFDVLEEKGVFTSLMMGYIKVEPTRPEKVRHLLDDLSRRGPKAYRLFLESLRESGQGFLADMIEEKERGIRRGVNSESLPSPFERSASLPTTSEVHHPTSDSEAPYMYFGISMNRGTSLNNASHNTPVEGNNNGTQSSYSMENNDSTDGTQDMDLDELDLSSPINPSMSQINVSLDTNQPASEYQKYRSKNKCYKMDSDPRGKAIIINNKHFLDGTVREGTDTDAQSLQDLFQNHLGLDVTVLEDLTALEMETHLQRLALDPVLDRVDCLVVCILSHGNNGVIQGTDLLNIETEKLFSIFGSNNCIALNQKPKLFLINACRGDRVGEIIYVSNTVYHDAVERDANPLSSVQRTLSAQSDIAIAYSTFPGFVSLRDTIEGSWYVQSFVEVLRNSAHNEHFTDMLTEVELIHVLDSTGFSRALEETVKTEVLCHSSCIHVNPFNPKYQNGKWPGLLSKWCRCTGPNAIAMLFIDEEVVPKSYSSRLLKCFIHVITYLWPLL